MLYKCSIQNEETGFMIGPDLIKADDEEQAGEKYYEEHPEACMEGDELTVEPYQAPSIDDIIDQCHALLANEQLVIEGFGPDEDITLDIEKDCEYDPSVDEDYSDLVDIVVFKDGQLVEDAVSVYVTDGCLCRVLERLERCEFEGTL